MRRGPRRIGGIGTATGQEVLGQRCVPFPQCLFARTSVDAHAGFCHPTFSTSSQSLELRISSLTQAFWQSFSDLLPKISGHNIGLKLG
jgi:hypothetical protein